MESEGSTDRICIRDSCYNNLDGSSDLNAEVGEKVVAGVSPIGYREKAESWRRAKNCSTLVGLQHGVNDDFSTPHYRPHNLDRQDEDRSLLFLLGACVPVQGYNVCSQRCAGVSVLQVKMVGREYISSYTHTSLNFAIYSGLSRHPANT